MQTFGLDVRGANYNSNDNIDATGTHSFPKINHWTFRLTINRDITPIKMFIESVYVLVTFVSKENVPV